MYQMKKKRTTLKELVAKECIVAPCIYDCMSAKAAEIAGYKALLLSGGEIEEAQFGLPNMGIHTIDDLCEITYNISSVSPLPISVDMDNGFGEPLAVFRNCERLVRAGAMGIQLEDKACAARARHILDVQLADTLKAHELKENNQYEKIDKRGKALVGAQATFMKEAVEAAKDTSDPKQSRVFTPAEKSREN